MKPKLRQWVTNRSWILLAVTFLLALVSFVAWRYSRNVRCVDLSVSQPRRSRPAPVHARLLRVQDDQDPTDDPTIHPPDPSERDQQAEQRGLGSDCAARIDKYNSVRAIALGLTGVSAIGTGLSLYLDKEAYKRHRRRRRKRAMPIA